MEEEKILRQKEQRRREKERSMMEKMKTRLGKSKKQVQQPNSSSGRMSSASSYPPGTIVRGPDGNLYRIVAPSRRRWESDDDESMASSINNNIERKSSMSCDENKENEEETDTDTGSTDSSMQNDTVMKKDELSYTPSRSETSSLRYDLDNDDSQIKSHTSYKHPMYKKGEQKDKAAVPLSEIVVVENVPDEEDDELRELHSIWRNRTPSPGQWMEPIESFSG